VFFDFLGPPGFDSKRCSRLARRVIVCEHVKSNIQIVNGNVITNEVGSYADVLAVVKANKTKSVATPVVELELA
jgi:hypothetical protein